MRKIVAVLGIAGLVLMACGGGGGASSPEAAVRGMFDAMAKGDIDGMAQYMPADERAEIEEMSNEEKEMMAGFLTMLGSLEYSIKGSRVDGDRAFVTVEITIFGETEEDEIELMQENGRWVITGEGMLF